MNSYSTAKSKALLYIKGVFMGTADVIPGVSGGTVAFLTGIYEDLLDAITSFQPRHLRDLAVLLIPGGAVEKRVEARRALGGIPWAFLIPLGAGIATAILTLAKLIPFLIQTFPFYAYALFFGLIAFSSLVPYRRTRDHRTGFLGLVIFAALTFFILQPGVGFVGSLSPGYLFFSGFISICALLLPGISGSFILVVLGQYVLVLSAIRDFNIPIVAVFGMGAICGLLGFSRILKFLLANYHNFMMGALTGMMLGSLRVIWPGYYVSESLGLDGVKIGIAVALAVLGGVIVIALEFMGPSDEASPSPVGGDPKLIVSDNTLIG